MEMYKSETSGLKIFLLILSIGILVISIFNAINYHKILKSDNDEDLGVPRGKATAFYWINIVLACISGFIIVYTLIVYVAGKTLKDDNMTDVYKSKAKNYFKELLKQGKNTVEATEGVAMTATMDAIKQGKNLTEAMNIGITAGTFVGSSEGYNEGDAKLVSTMGAESVVKKEIEVRVKADKKDIKK